VLRGGLLDYVAVTDHNRIDFALSLQRELGDRIVVGEEITTPEGEIIGLFMTKAIAKNTPLIQAVHEIKAQGGLVYIPHPLETIRKGLNRWAMASIINDTDIIETINGRAFWQNRGPQAAAAAGHYGKPGCAASDAHGQRGLGTTYTEIARAPTSANLADQLRSARLVGVRPPFITLLYPKINRLKKRLGVPV
jgi:predicted metal-dependent phosphoesterase TrpH